MIRSKISGVGYYVPDNIVKNSDLEEMMNTSDQWIKERTGIEERRWVNNDKLSTSLMGTYASESAVDPANPARILPSCRTLILLTLLFATVLPIVA